VAPVVAAIALLLLFPLHDSRPANAATDYLQARQLFLQGELEKSQHSAHLGFLRFESVEPEWASQFRLLEAQSMLFRGLYNDSLVLLAPFHPDANHPNELVEKLSIEAVALSHNERLDAANGDLSEGDLLCANTSNDACGQLLRAHGIIATQRGKLAAARQYFLDCLDFARTHHDRELESNAWLNLGWVSLHDDRYDEAVDWSRSAYAASLDLGNQNRAQIALGNLGWSYFELGDTERALGMLLQAEDSARRIGNTGEELRRLTDAGYVQQNTGDYGLAIASYRKAFALAEKINSKEDIMTSLEVLAHLSIETGKLDEANAYVQRLLPLVRTTASHLDDLDVALAQGKIAAAQSDDSRAESIFRVVASDPASQTPMRLDAERELARLDERRGDLDAADRMYATALDTFEQARRQLQNEDSKLPFLANAAPIYDDYIGLLLKQGRTQQALAVADHSRARTLAQGLGLAIPADPTALDAGRIAQKAGATLLFYWLGHPQSWLWIVTPQKTSLVPLPAQNEIASHVTRYRDALLGPDDPLQSENPDGLALYNELIAPAAPFIPPGGNVIILADGPLSQLNFETLLVPTPQPHYWIEDATVASAPSLYMLASANRSAAASARVLLLGDALSPNPDYPELPKAAVEMSRIQSHFPAHSETIFSGPEANPDAYLSSNPGQYAYIHFVAHGVASQTDPLDSAIILSRSTSAEDSFKLYARSIIQHPLHARLVTISSCYGGGTRSFAGEGLVGLSWAFLRAGAHNVIGALWEVSDNSTPALMDSLYQGLERGLPPSAALRQAKLSLLHAHGDYRQPFFWAPFQIYTGL
jgi:CHAT domain-containing protein